MGAFGDSILSLVDFFAWNGFVFRLGNFRRESRVAQSRVSYALRLFGFSSFQSSLGQLFDGCLAIAVTMLEDHSEGGGRVASHTNCQWPMPLRLCPTKHFAGTVPNKASILCQVWGVEVDPKSKKDLRIMNHES